MNRKRLNEKSQIYILAIILVTAGIFSILSIDAISNTSQIWALEGTSTQTMETCINNQPCQTMVCSEGQPCKVSQTPNTDFDSEFDIDEAESVPQPLGGEETLQQPLEGTGTDTTGLVPFTDPYNNNYPEDQEEYLEDRQDMMEDAEYE
jgi:hypothetical protein